MSFISERLGESSTGASALPVLGNPGIPAQGDDLRFFVNMPSVQKSLSRKLSSTYPSLAAQGADPTVLRVLQQLDTSRANRGQNPLSEDQTKNAILAATPTAEEPYGRTVQPVQERGVMPWDLPANAAGDLREMFTSIPKLPALLWQTAMDLPDAPEKLADALGKGDWQAASQVPGINLIPGAYTVGNLLSGNAAEALRHPLFTALDVLPYAKGKFFTPPESMLDDAGRLVNRSVYDTTFPKSFRRGIAEAQAAMPEKVSAWDLAKNATGGRYETATDAAKFRFRGSRLGRAEKAALSTQTRDYMAQMNQMNRLVSEIQNPESMAWKIPAEREVLYKGLFNPDEPWVKSLWDFNHTYGDEFAKQQGISPEDWAHRRTEVATMLETDPRAIAGLGEAEQTYASRYRELQREIAEPYLSRASSDQRPFMEIDLGGGKEIVPFKRGAALTLKRDQAALAREMADIGGVVKGANTALTADDIFSRMQESRLLNDPMVSRKVRLEAMEGYTHALLERGVDARASLKSIIGARNRYGGATAEMLTDTAELSKTLPHQLYSIDDLRNAIHPTFLSSTGREIRQNLTAELAPLMEAIDGGKVSRIRTQFNKLYPKLADNPRVPETFRALDPADVNQSLDLIAKRDRWISRNAHPDPERVARQLDRSARKLEEGIVPARWTPLVGQAVRERMGAIADEVTTRARMDPDTAAEIVGRVNRGEYSELDRALGSGLDDLSVDESLIPRGAEEMGWKGIYRAVVKDEANGWRALQAEGIDPVYVHHVGLGKTSKVHFPGVNLSGKEPSSWQERSLDFSPSERDLSVALNHQAVEILQKKAEDLLLDRIVSGSPEEGWAPMAKTYAQLTDEMRPLIERYMEQHRGMDWETAANNVTKKTWVKFDAPSYRNYGTAEAPLYPGGGRTRPGQVSSAGQADNLYIPRNLHDAMVKMQEAPRASMVWDPVMNAFRVSTLLLSPRWQVYNVLGNALTVTMNEGVGWVKHVPEGWRAARAMARGEAIATEMPAALRQSLGQAPVEHTQYLELGKQGLDQASSALDNVIGKGTTQRIVNWGRPLGKGFNKLTDLSIRMNAMVDDTTRIAGYLSAQDRALARALPMETKQWLREQGIKAGDNELAKSYAETEMRKWAYNWDSMTPWERSTARFVFPFYGFFSHMMRYAYQYAMDHPLRVALTASFARAEMQDWGTGLPARLHNLLLVGKADEEGNTKAINFGGWNPFADTANLFSLTGWLSQANPVISTIAEQFGIDPRTGEASLYPSSSFDEQTGRLALQKRGIASSFLSNVIPQSQIATSLLGMNPDINDLSASNPDAAQRLLAGAAGLPVLVRDVNIPEEVTKTELARENAARSAFAAALRSGSTGPVRAYPALVKQAAQIQAQIASNPAKFAEYQPSTHPMGTYDLARGALLTAAGVG